MHRLVLALRPHVDPTPHIPVAEREAPLLDEDAVICIRAVRGTQDGDVHLARAVALSVGARVRKDHPFVKAYPKSFVLVVPAGRTRLNSVRALSDWAETRRDENGIYIEETDATLRSRFGDHKRFILWRKGMWVDRDNPVVHAYPANFQAIL